MKGVGGRGTLRLHRVHGGGGDRFGTAGPQGLLDPNLPAAGAVRAHGAA